MTYKYILKLLPKRWLVLLVVTMIVASFDGVVISTVISHVTTFNKSTSISHIIVFSTISLLVYVVILTIGQLGAMCKNYLIKLINVQLKQKYLRRTLYDSNYACDTDQVSSFLLNDFRLLETNYLVILSDMIAYIITGIVSMLYLLYLDPLIAVLFILCSFLPMLPPKLFAKRMEQVVTNWSQENEQFTAKLKDIFHGRKVIKTYGVYPFALEQLSISLFNEEEKNMVLNNEQSFVGYISAVLSWISYILPISVALYLVTQGQLEVGAVVAMFLASDRVIGPLRRVSFYQNRINTTATIRKNIWDVINRNEVKNISHVLARPSLNLKKVTFAYETQSSLLEEVTLTIPYGEKILISGASGSGKTTVLDLMQGVLKPISGNILLVEQNEVSNDLINHVARIYQDPILFMATIRENLSLGKDIKDETLLRVLSEVGLVEELGEDVLNKIYDDKANLLSGGQKQRIEIARAIIHGKAILLVDEATSALDKENSQKIRDILSSLPCTVIEIAHHFTKEDIVRYQLKHLVLENKTLIEI